MSKRKLPAATVSRRPGVRSDVVPSIVERWNAGIMSAATDDASIDVLDVIGEDFWGEGVTAKRIASHLRRLGAEADVTVNINSPGGDFFEGLAIYNTLREHKGRVTVRILGLAASAASVIAMAGDDVRIARAGFLMVHNTWVVAMGDRHDLRDVADWLETFDATAVDLFASRTGIEAEKIAGLLDRETWIGGQAAVDGGWADALLASDEIEAGEPADPQQKTLRKLEMYLSRGGASRSERREMVKDIVGGTPSAAPSGMPSAAVIDGVTEILSSMKRI